jgi:hypothetical protein
LWGWYSTHKNYVLYMRECVGNYSIPTANGNVECVDKLAGAGILNFLNISHNRPLLVPLIVLLIIVVFVVKLLSCTKRIPIQTQFAGLTYIDRCYWYCTVASWKRPTSKFPSQCTYRVGELAESKHTKLNQMCHKQ